MQPNNPQRPGVQRPQFLDVVRPGRTPAGPNARPTLAPNRPPVADNSMKMGAPAVPPGLMSSPRPVAPPQPAPAPMRPQPMPQPMTAPAVRPAMPIMPQNVGRPPAVEGSAPGMPASEPIEALREAPAHHSAQKHSVWSEVLAIMAILILVGIIVDILLDAKVLHLSLPHTNFFNY